MRTIKTEIIIVNGISSETLSLINSLTMKISSGKPKIDHMTMLFVHSSDFEKVNPKFYNAQLKRLAKKHVGFEGYFLFCM